MKTRIIRRKLFFVGIHKKPGETPLSSNTKTGKIIDSIIDEIYTSLNGCEWVKTNLYSMIYIPRTKSVKENFSWCWWMENNPSDNDIIILLGNEVKNNFIRRSLKNIIEVRHPGRLGSKEKQRKYIKEVVQQIKNKI